MSNARNIRKIIAPLRKVGELEELLKQGKGDLTFRLEIKSNDEVGKLSGSLNEFLARLSTLIEDIRQQSGKTKQNSAELRILMDKADKTVQDIVESINQIKEKSALQAALVEASAVRSVEKANATQKQNEQIAGQVAEITHSSARIEDMITGIKMIAENLEKSDEQLGALNEQTETGKKAITQLKGTAAQEIDKTAQSLVENDENIEAIEKGLSIFKTK
jgi:methyl-accepting chemotaxis protein